MASTPTPAPDHSNEVRPTVLTPHADLPPSYSSTPAGLVESFTNLPFLVITINNRGIEMEPSVGDSEHVREPLFVRYIAVFHAQALIALVNTDEV